MEPTKPPAPPFHDAILNHRCTLHIRSSIPLLPTALPFALLALVVLLSFSYRHVKRLKLAPSRRNQLNVFHAFATEGVQFGLALLCVANTGLAFSLLQGWGTACELSGFKSSVVLGVGVTGVIALHALAIYAVDILEARILLGQWTHPYGWCCFVITRTKLFPSSGPKQEAKPKGRLLSRDDDTSVSERREIVKQEYRLHRVKQRLKRVDWLDLACLRNVQQPLFSMLDDGWPVEGDSPCQKCLRAPSAGSSGFSTETVKLANEVSMPTPPDSRDLPSVAATTGAKQQHVQAAMNKRVSWTFQRTEMSPGGTLRRQSLP
ncbi:hypothetical protein LTR37_019296 [Vermiconidia calcicola]|uniref:Uncharacterized protein n=1 Tax=Vermiconidia calcicola TaxID=1690605 RepID=A0ACC3MEU5_9PEZI|nr:hypothetical protein LTR37_019296 [Vermiconidia calcicola]